MGLIRAGPVLRWFPCTLLSVVMRNVFLSLLATALLTGGAAQAQAPAAEVLSLTKRLNELVRPPKSDDDTRVMVSLANCGVRQTFLKYRTTEKASASNVNLDVSSSKKGGSWAVKTNDKVELELNFSLDWAEVGSINYVPKKEEKNGRGYYELTVKRREKSKGKSSSGLPDSISFDLHTQNEKEVADLVRRLSAVSRQCQGQKS